MAKISLDLIQELRGKTGVGMMDCKKALQETDGDVQKAIELLRKKGAAVAEKRSGKETKQGLVHSYIHPGALLGVLVQIDCETDFVARTDDVKNFARDICMHIAALNPRCISAEQLDPAYIEQEKKLMIEQLKEAGKPDNMIEKIVEGKVKKLSSEVCLLNQPFVKNDQVSVQDLLKDLIAKMGENIKISRFARFEVGQ